ncbi:hypothetical protein BGW38_000434 [Lunasporangiospora selenospora]|uniref:Uncharacterized protein n=1 Tax=Lunasporangiospora selenospora TaxID=979761 RepID=A0A9P6KF02_9FUNG|nr:hypothetical protein BGW38_000434 [Lunasporangiospora selenospora]
MLPFPSNSRKDTADTAKALISNFFVFQDLAADPPTDENYAKGLNFRPMNLVEDIDNFYHATSGSSLSNDGKTDPDSEDDGESEEGDDDDDSIDGSGDPSGAAKDVRAGAISFTDREFNDGISAILAKARDGHLSYDADCFRTFIFQHGFVMGHVARNGKKVIKVFDVKSYLWSSQYALASKIYGMLQKSQALPMRKFYDKVEAQPSTKYRGEAASYQSLNWGKHNITAILLGDEKTGVIAIQQEYNLDSRQSFNQFYS